MDSISLVMFGITFMVGLIFTLLGFTDLKDAVSKKDVPYLGFVFFLISMGVWFVMGMYWPAVATDAALGSLGWLWLGFGGTCLTCAMACIGFILKASVQPEGVKLEVRQRERERE